MAFPSAGFAALLLTWVRPVIAEQARHAPTPTSVFDVEYGVSLFNEDTGFLRAHAVNLSWSYLFGGFAVGIQTGANVWRAPLFGSEEQEHVGVFNLGPKIEWRFADERARSQLGVGMSVVIEPSAVDAHAGALGFYIDARPLGLRLPAGNGWAVGFDPLGSALRVPDTTGVPLVEVQFMTYLRLEAKR